MGARSSAVRAALVVVFLGASCACPSPLFAQPVANRAVATRLEHALRAGDTVRVTRPDGSMLRGRFVMVTSEGVLVQTKEGRLALGLDEIQTVRRTRMGFVLGPLIGVGVGAVLSAPALACDHCQRDADMFFFSAGLGAAVGLAIDVFVNLPRTVYERDRRLALAPLVTPHAVGLGVHVTF